MRTRAHWVTALFVALVAALMSNQYLSWANKGFGNSHQDLANLLTWVTWLSVVVLGVAVVRWRDTDAGKESDDAAEETNARLAEFEAEFAKASAWRHLFSSIAIGLAIAAAGLLLLALLFGLALSSAVN